MLRSLRLLNVKINLADWQLSKDSEESYCADSPDSDIYPSVEGQFYDSDDFDWLEHVRITI